MPSSERSFSSDTPVWGQAQDTAAYRTYRHRRVYRRGARRPLFGARRYPDIEGVEVLELVEPQPVEVVDFMVGVYAGQTWACAGHGGGEAGAER